MEQYRTELLAFGMQEPSKRESSVGHWYFFKPMMERTAFIVNLIGNDQYIEIIYGYTSTAFTRLNEVFQRIILLFVRNLLFAMKQTKKLQEL